TAADSRSPPHHRTENGAHSSVRSGARSLVRRHDQLIAVAGARWAIEACFQSAKGECGLDHYQVRRYQGWYRHITLAMAAHAFLTATRATELATGKAETDPPDWSRSASRNSDA
ncbi:hypothetical protein ACH4GP_38275, partial [Streptomyces celluloflavus]